MIGEARLSSFIEWVGQSNAGYEFITTLSDGNNPYFLRVDGSEALVNSIGKTILISNSQFTNYGDTARPVYLVRDA